MSDPLGIKHELMKRIDLGIAAENFLRSDVCKALADQMEEEREEFIRKLIDCSPSDTPTNIALRLEVSKREEWQFRIAGLKADGDNARVELNSMEAEQGD